MRQRLLVSFLVSFLFVSCSIFDLKNPEAPSLGSTERDPLNIRDILMTVAHEVAADMDYRDYFTDDITFEYPGAIRPMQGKTNMLRMLDYLRLQVSQVDWQVEKAQKIPQTNNLWIVRNMPYIVYSSDGEQICTGKADFHIVKKADWMISQWKDMPDENGNAFFEP